MATLVLVLEPLPPAVVEDVSARGGAGVWHAEHKVRCAEFSQVHVVHVQSWYQLGDKAGETTAVATLLVLPVVLEQVPLALPPAVVEDVSARREGAGVWHAAHKVRCAEFSKVHVVHVQ